MTASQSVCHHFHILHTYYVPFFTPWVKISDLLNKHWCSQATTKIWHKKEICKCSSQASHNQMAQGARVLRPLNFPPLSPSCHTPDSPDDILQSPALDIHISPFYFKLVLIITFSELEKKKRVLNLCYQYIHVCKNSVFCILHFNLSIQKWNNLTDICIYIPIFLRPGGGQTGENVGICRSNHVTSHHIASSWQIGYWPIAE